MSKAVMELALEALEKALRYHGVMLLSDPPQDAWKYHRVEQTAQEALTALRERLAQPEPKHDDPIGDAQDKLIAEQAARPCKVGGPCVPTQIGPCACKELPPPIGPVVEQPQMQPCAGRNCGSTNPNLHSAECFEDYEKSTGMSQWQGLTEEEINNSYLFWVVDQQDVIGFGKSLETKLKKKNI